MHVPYPSRGMVAVGAVALLTVLSLAACNDNSPTPKTPDTASLASVGTDMGTAGVFGAQSYALGILVNAKDQDAPGILLPQHPTPGDTLLPGVLTCPVVYPGEPQGAAFTIVMDFGDGCESILDGAPASGKITFVVNDRPPTGIEAEVDFTDSGFTRGDLQVDGLLSLTGDSQNQTTINAQALGLTSSSGSVLLNAALDAERVTEQAPPGPAYCSQWRIVSGTGSVVVANTNFKFTVVDTVMLSTCCAYPLSGSIEITSAGYQNALLDFGTGECDAAASITVGGKTQAITLGTGQ
jgi:hypothetical protein